MGIKMSMKTKTTMTTPAPSPVTPAPAAAIDREAGTAGAADARLTAEKVQDMVSDLDGTLVDLEGEIMDGPPAALLKPLAVELARSRAALEIHCERLRSHSSKMRSQERAEARATAMKRQAVTRAAEARGVPPPAGRSVGRPRKLDHDGGDPDYD